MSNVIYYNWPAWPKKIDIPLAGALTIYDSGGSGGSPSNYLSLKLEDLSQEEYVIARRLIGDFLLMELAEFSSKEGAQSHCLVVGGVGLDAQPLSLPQLRIREEEDDYRVSGPPDEQGRYCPDPILHLYSFIKDPDAYTKVFVEREGLPEPDIGGTP